MDPDCGKQGQQAQQNCQHRGILSHGLALFRSRGAGWHVVCIFRSHWEYYSLRLRSLNAVWGIEVFYS